MTGPPPGAGEHVHRHRPHDPLEGLRQQAVPGLPVMASGTPDFSAITDRYGSAVVNISVSGVKHGSADAEESAAARGLPPGIDPEDPFYEFFRRFQGQGGQRAPREETVRGQGSGFIVSADGLILTNAHVVRDASEVIVKLTDRREFKAKVLGSDPKTDVAVNPGNSGGRCSTAAAKWWASIRRSTAAPAVTRACPLPSRSSWPRR